MSLRTTFCMMHASTGAGHEGPISDDLALDELHAYAVWQGYLDGGTFRADIMISTVMVDLKRDFGLSPMQAMATYARLKGIEAKA
jgi:hypothetical protein